MNVITSLTAESKGLMQARGLTDVQITDFATLLEDAHQQQENNISATQILQNMTKSELALIQTVTSLAAPIDVNSLSKEGATNLLAQPDRTGLVDLNNDGIVEVGAGRNIMFPPVNAPAYAKAAWDKATEGLSFQDKAIIEFNMHISVYGVEINGMPTKQAPSPEKQWSADNIVQRDFYDKFESFLV